MKERDSSRGLRTITDPRQALFLTSARSRGFITPFLAQSKTVTQAASELRLKTNAMLYRVQQMRGLGLIEIATLKPRAGRAIRYYRSVADEFFVPFLATSFETLEAHVLHNERSQHQHFARAFAATRRQQRTQHWGTLIRRDEVGNVYLTSTQLEHIGTPQRAAFTPFSVWSEVTLRPESAAAFSRRLNELLEEYLEQPSEPDGAAYLLHVGMVQA